MAEWTPDQMRDLARRPKVGQADIDSMRKALLHAANAIEAANAGRGVTDRTQCPECKGSGMRRDTTPQTRWPFCEKCSGAGSLRTSKTGSN